MENEQKQAWLDYSKGITIGHIKNSYKNPTNFQTEFNTLLKEIVIKNKVFQQSKLDVKLELV